MLFARLSLVLLLGACSSTPIYAPCDDGSECEGPADGCFRLLFTRSDGSDADGTLCSKQCASDADCPDGGVCLGLAGDAEGTFLCLEPCGGDTCFVGHSCTIVDGASVERVCLPE